MGNILGLLRYGQTGTDSYGLIDNLNLTYHGNQLQSVYDNATNSVFGNGMEFKDTAHETVEYAYDKNGNLTKDLNKNISEIQYNILNLPSHISFADGNSIEYEYAADGRKVRTTHTINNNVTSTVYCGNAVYENGSLKILLNESGYYSFQDNKFHFYIKDHQGNIRVVADEAGKVDEVNDYYPFGGLMSNACNNVQPYKYNGKELDRKGGLDWYDYGARHYDAALGRWHAVDLVAESFCNLSPYQYVKNIPHKLIDPSGMVPVDSLTWETFNPNEDVIELNEVRATAASPYVNETVGGLTYSVNVFTGRRRLIGETGLKNVYPEYDLIAFARFLAGQGAKKGINQAGRIAASRTASNRLSQNAIDKGIQYAMKGAKFDHIFGKSAHNLEALTAHLGGERNVVSATLNALNNGGHLEASGIMQEITVNVAGSNVVVRFVVHDGFPKIGTMYIP